MESQCRRMLWAQEVNRFVFPYSLPGGPLARGVDRPCLSVVCDVQAAVWEWCKAILPSISCSSMSSMSATRGLGE